MDALDGDSDLSDLSDAPSASASKSPLQGSAKLNTSPAKTMSKAQSSRASKAVPAATSAASASASTSASASASASASPEHGRRKSLRVSVDGEKEATAALSSPSKPVTYGRNKASRPSRVSVRGTATQLAEVPVPVPVPVPLDASGAEGDASAEQPAVERRRRSSGRMTAQDLLGDNPPGSKAEVEATETSAEVLARDKEMDDAPRSARGRRINAGKNFVLDKQRASDTASARLSTVGRRDSAGGSAKKKSAAKECDKESPSKEADGTAEKEKGKFKVKLIRKNKVGENGAVPEGGQDTSASMSVSPLSDLSDAEAKSGASEEEDEGPMVSKRRSRSSLVTGRPTQRGALVSSVDAEAPVIQSKVASKKKKKKKVLDSDSDGGDYKDEEARHEEMDLEMGVEESDDEDAYEEEKVPAKRKKASREEARRGPTERGAAPSASKKKRVESLFSEEEGEEKKPSKKEVEQRMKKKKSMSGMKAPLNNSAVSTPTSHGAGASRTSTTAPGVIPLPRKAGGHLTQSIASASSTHTPTSNTATSTAIKKPSVPAPRKSGGMAAFSNIFGGLPTPGGTRSGGAALGMRSNHRLGLGGRQATSWGANGEHMTEAMISQQRTEEVHRNANPQNLFDLLLSSELLIDWETETRRYCASRPEQYRSFKVSRGDNASWLIEKIRRERARDRQRERQAGAPPTPAPVAGRPAGSEVASGTAAGPTV
ncbi:hypothetical protein CBOM_05856 [Ceraceosorus bombacis]|uniref:Uncharacterized protein n=1 Tax=Ceraceosorus bombacis TaxID=401625 RepID=A0A0P1BQC2_9BASI|nr:hypothetical protein CBOM_05856 [Ceraceosorus bombacis]